MKQGGRLASRRSAQESYNNNRGGRRGGFYLGMRLKLDERPTRLVLHRFKEEDAEDYKLYADPNDPEVGYYWKYGLNYFLKLKGDRYRSIEWTPEDNLIEAYRDPAKHGFAELDEAAAGAWLKKFPARPYFCISGWVEDWYHLVEKKNDKTEKTYVDRVRCEGRGCPHCQEKWPKVFGNRFWMDFSGAQWMNVMDKLLEELDRCPQDGGYVYPLHYACEECGEILEFVDPKSKRDVRLDMTNSCPSCGSEEVGIDPEEHMAECNDCHTRWPLLTHEDDDLKRYVDTVMKCQACGHQGYPKAVMEHSEGLEEWESSSLFDCAITMYKTMEGDKGRLHIKKWEFSEPDPRLFDPRFQGWDGDEKNTEAKEIAEKWVERHKQALDLDKVHQVQDPDQVAETIELPNLFAVAAGGGSKRQAYKPRAGRLKKTEE